MKFVPKSIPKVNIPAFSRGNLWIFGIGVVAIIIILSVIIKFGFGSHSRIEDALLSGQRVEISLETGEIHGKILTTETDDNEIKKEEIAKTPAKDNAKDEIEIAVNETDEVSTKQSDEEIKQTKKADGDAPKKKATKDLAWIEEDFIGPRISKLMMEALIGGTAKELELKKISVSDLGEKPIIIVIIKGLGLSASTTEQAIGLPKNITLGFSPYAPDLEKWTERAKEEGHEILLNIPMETKDFNINDPGPYALVTSSSKDDNATRLKMILSLIKDYKAVYSENEEIFTKSVKSVKGFLELLKSQGKYFVYGGGYAEFSLIQVAESIQYPILVNDILLDDVISQQGINQKLREIESRAKERGYVVVMAHPYPITIRMLERWLPQVEARGLKVAPASLLLGKAFVD